MKCRFCNSDAAAVFTLEEGCLCFPAEREHAYCIQHIIRANPIGSMLLKEILDPERIAFYRQWQDAISISPKKESPIVPLFDELTE